MKSMEECVMSMEKHVLLKIKKSLQMGLTCWAWVERHWLLGKEKVLGAVIDRGGHADSFLEPKRTHYLLFSWEKSNCKQCFLLPCVCVCEIKEKNDIDVDFNANFAYTAMLQFVFDYMCFSKELIFFISRLDLRPQCRQYKVDLQGHLWSLEAIRWHNMPFLAKRNEPDILKWITKNGFWHYKKWNRWS